MYPLRGYGNFATASQSSFLASLLHVLEERLIFPRNDLNPPAESRPIWRSCSRGFASHGKVVKNLAASYVADRRSPLPVNLVPKPGILASSVVQQMLNTIGDDFPSIITNQKDAVKQGLHLWLVFSLSGVAFTDLWLTARFSIRVCSLIALVFVPATVFAAGFG
jgi:hypothetical protein